MPEPGALALRTLGETGPDVVLVHGFGSDRLSWLANAPALAERCRVHTLDLPGHGDTPIMEGDVGPRALAALVAGAMERHGLVAAHLVGHSLGGAVALALAQDRPARVRSLALIAPAGLGAGVDHGFLAAYPAMDDVEAALAQLRQLVARPALITRPIAERALAQLQRPGARDGLRRIAEGLLAAEQGVDAVAGTVARRGLPRWVCWGEADTINPLARGRLEAFGGEHTILPQTGHLPHIEAARVFNAGLAAFIARVEGQA